MRGRAIFGCAIAILGAAAFDLACSRGARTTAPVASLPASSDAVDAYAVIREGWEARKLDGHACLLFVGRFPNDGATPLVKAFLAFALFEKGQLAQADDVLASVASVPPGRTKDLVTVAQARSLRLHGAPQSALDSLRPLVGKVIDDADREVYLEEIALTSIAARDDYEALAYLDGWLRGVGEDDRERVRAKVEQIVDTLPREVLEQSYRAMRTRGTSSGYSADTQTIVAARLARIAVDSNDAALARWLLEVSGASASQTGGDAGVELFDLAASRRGLSVVSGRTVGLLLPTRTRELRDEAADVVRGVSWALDLPRRPGSTDGVRLVTRDDGPDEPGTRAAMDELAGEGATVILAGFDRASADRVSKWSEEKGVPVVLLAAPSAPYMPKKSAVVLGERTEREVAMLGEALVRHGAKTSAFVTDTFEDEVAGRTIQAPILLPPVRCDIPIGEAGKPRFPVEAWFSAGAHAWLVSGPASCARDLLRDIGRYIELRPSGTAIPGGAKVERVIALTLEAGVPPTEVPKGVVALSASAGIVPVAATKPEQTNEPDVKEFMQRFGVRPSYWTAIGRDAGVIARAAIAPLPADTTSDPKGVGARRAIVQAGIVATRVHLWTSDDEGVGPDRILPRALRLVTWTGGN